MKTHTKVWMRRWKMCGHWTAPLSCWPKKLSVAGSQSTAPLVSSTVQYSTVQLHWCPVRGNGRPSVQAHLTMQMRRGSGSHVVRMLYVPLEIIFIFQEVFCEMHDLGDVTSTFHTISIASSGHQFLSLICNNLWWKFLSLNNDEGFHKTVIILESVFDKSECVCESFVIS